MHITLWNKIRKMTIAVIVLGSLMFAPFSSSGIIEKAHAQLGPFTISGAINVQDVPQTFVNTVAQLSGVALEQKELVLDGLFYDIAQQALQQMTGDILKFINSGFDGEPAFVTDLNEHLQDISDDAVADFFYGDQLSSLCTPFQLDARISGVNAHKRENGHTDFKEQVACTLDDYSNDQEAFLKGDIYAGGWSAWFEVVLNPVNTKLGAQLAVDVAADNIKEDTRREAIEEYRANNGFLSQKVCADGSNGTGPGCSTVTPGILLQQQASAALEIPMLSLLNADEMNETIGALFGNLANQALTGVNGLLGLGGNASFSANSFGTSGNVSYLDAVVEEGKNNSQTGSGTGSKIQQALITETRVLELQLAIVSEIDEVTKLFEEKFTPHKNDSCWNLEIPEKLSTTLDDLLIKVPVTATTVVRLQELANQYEEASGSSGQLKALQTFTSMQQDGLITGQAAAVTYDYLLNSELKKIINEFIKAITAEEKSC